MSEKRTERSSHEEYLGNAIYLNKRSGLVVHVAVAKAGGDPNGHQPSML